MHVCAYTIAVAALPILRVALFYWDDLPENVVTFQGWRDFKEI